MADISKKLSTKLTHTALKVLNYFMLQPIMKFSESNIIRKIRFFIRNYCPIMQQLKSANWFCSRWEDIASQKTSRQFGDGTLADWLRRCTVKRPYLSLQKRRNEVWAPVLNDTQGPHAKLLYALVFLISVIRQKTNSARKTGGADAAWPITQNGLECDVAPGLVRKVAND